MDSQVAARSPPLTCVVCLQVADLHAAATRMTHHRYSSEEQAFVDLSFTLHQAKVSVPCTAHSATGQRTEMSRR